MRPADGAAGTCYRSLPSWESAAVQGAVMRGRFRDGSPLLHFLHGNGLCAGVYWPLLRPLSQGCGLLTQDFEGHGESDAVPRFRGAGHLARRMLDNLDGLLGGRALIGIGHSYGAALSLKMALAAPQRFRALVLLDPILPPPAMWMLMRLVALSGRHPLSAPTRRRRHRWPDREAAMNHLRGRGVYAGWHESALRAFAEEALRDTAEGVELVCDREIEASIFEHPIGSGWRIRALKLPVLAISGRRSYPFMPAVIAGLSRACPQLAAEQVDGGHCFMLERPEEIASLLRHRLRERGLLPG